MGAAASGPVCPGKISGAAESTKLACLAACFITSFCRLFRPSSTLLGHGFVIEGNQTPASNRGFLLCFVCAGFSCI